MKSAAKTLATIYNDMDYLVKEGRVKYKTSSVDFGEFIANLLLKRDKIEMAGLGNMITFCLTPPKFTFPYSENIVVLEVASEKSHQSISKYCDQTRRDINRKGMTMTSLMNLSILDTLKVEELNIRPKTVFHE